MVSNVEKRPKPDYELASIPTVSSSKIASFSGTKQLLDEVGPKGVAEWVKSRMMSY